MFKVNRKALERELSLLATVAERKQTIPVLGSTLFNFSGNTLILTATDMDTSLITEMEASGDSWAGCIPSRQLYELTRLSGSEDIEFVPEDGRIAVKWDKSRHRLPLFDPTEFPVIEQPSGEPVTVPGEVFRSAVTRVLPCVTSEEARYVLQGVKLEARDNTLKLIATNRHRLGVASISVEGSIDTLVPAAPLSAVLKTDSEFIEIQANENRAMFRCGQRLVIAQLLAGTFPNWEMIVPKAMPYQLEIATSDLVNALRRVDITRAETYKAGEGRILAGVRMVFERTALTVETDVSDRGESQEPLDAVGNLNGESIVVRINPDYVMDFLRYADDKVKFEIKDGSSVLRFTDSSDFQYVVIPMRL